MKYDQEKEGKNDSESDSENIFGLGGVFKTIEKLLDIASKLEKSGSIISENEFDSDKTTGGVKGVYGFTVKSAIGNIPKIETFGNIVKSAKGPIVNDEREPIIDIFDEAEEVVIIAEMPGVEEDEISIDVKDDILEISTINSKKRYRKEILLPFKKEKSSIISKYTNGILEIRINK